MRSTHITHHEAAPEQEKNRRIFTPMLLAFALFHEEATIVFFRRNLSRVIEDVTGLTGVVAWMASIFS